jgi:TPR repeat protein
MRKRGRFGSLLCATIAVAMAALIGAAGFGSTVLAQQAQTTGSVTFELFAGPDSVEQNSAEAAHWYYRAASGGDAAALYQLGVINAAGRGVEKDAKQAVFWYRAAAQRGQVEAMKALAEAYGQGIGVEKDAAKAAEWRAKAK